MSHVPYVTSEKKVEFGELVTELTLAGDRTSRPSTHVIHFTGSQPCHRDGLPIKGIQHSEGPQQLGEGITVHRSFSNKPAEGYSDYHHKLTRYAEILSSPAASLDPSVTARTYKPLPADVGTPFVYIDTNSSRGHIQATGSLFAGMKIGIIGLGGTGSYVLDLVAKTPVSEIRLFDGDLFLQHNAFRAPGAAELAQLEATPAKVDYLASIYSRMHRGILPYPRHLTAGDFEQLAGLSYVFICIDDGPAKQQLVDFLIERRIPLIDAGIGVQVVDNRLLGIVRVTSGTPAKHDHLTGRIPFKEAVDDAYSTNIQIADLNMLSASLAVIKWKKLLGFYLDLEHEHHTTYTIDGNNLLNEEIGAPLR
jgi:hypothetical protein